MARLYTKKVWFNDQTKLSAKNLNHIENGIEAVADAIDEIEAQGNVHTHNNKSILDYDDIESAIKSEFCGSMGLLKLENDYECN